MLIWAISFLLLMIVMLIVSIYYSRKNMERKLEIDISIKDMRDLEDRLKLWLEGHQLDTEANINDIANILKVRRGEDTITLDGEQAKLNETDEDGVKVVTFNAGLTENEKNFAFAHELGHLINKDPIPVARLDGQDKPALEQLADYMGAAILLPRKKIYDHLQCEKYLELDSRLQRKIIRNLCKEYHVDVMVVMRRIKEVYLLALAESVQT